MIIQILSHIPTWVLAVLAYGIIMGIRSMFPRSISLVVVAVLPIVFLGLSLTSLVSAIHAVALSAPMWAAGLIVGILAGLTVFSARILDANVGSLRLKIAGSPVTLILFVLIFATKFYYNMHIALDPAAATNAVFVCSVLALSGASTGIMIGRVSRLYAGYFSGRTLASAK